MFIISKAIVQLDYKINTVHYYGGPGWLGILLNIFVTSEIKQVTNQWVMEEHHVIQWYKTFIYLNGRSKQIMNTDKRRYNTNINKYLLIKYWRNIVMEL